MGQDILAIDRGGGRRGIHRSATGETVVRVRYATRGRDSLITALNPQRESKPSCPGQRSTAKSARSGLARSGILGARLHAREGTDEHPYALRHQSRSEGLDDNVAGEVRENRVGQTPAPEQPREQQGAGAVEQE